MPQRIQRKRTKGWRKPDGAVCVTRRGRMGNPFRMDAPVAVQFYRVMIENRSVPLEMEDEVYAYYRGVDPPTETEIKRRLRGHDLACFCEPDAPFCHADVLLEITNKP